MAGGETAKYNEVLERAMAAKTREEAMAVLEEYTPVCTAANKCSPKEGRRIALSNIGYYSGYHDRETRERVERLFGAVHPLLGPASRNLTPEQIFQIGVEWAKGKRTTLDEMDGADLVQSVVDGIMPE